MDYLAQHLGFIETDEMTRVRRALVEALAGGSEHVRALAEDYQIQAEAVVDATPDSKVRDTRRIGANIAMALTYLEAGRADEGIEDLDSVLDDIDGQVVGGREEFLAIAEVIEATIARWTTNEA